MNIVVFSYIMFCYSYILTLIQQVITHGLEVLRHIMGTWHINGDILLKIIILHLILLNKNEHAFTKIKYVSFASKSNCTNIYCKLVCEVTLTTFSLVRTDLSARNKNVQLTQVNYRID